MKPNTSPLLRLLCESPRVVRWLLAFSVISGCAADAVAQAETERTLWTVGFNFNGQLGDGTTTNRSVPVQAATGVVVAAAGASHSLFVASDGSLRGAGHNVYGQLGDGTMSDRRTAVTIANDVVAAAGSLEFSVFLKADRTLWGMGSNGSWQIGEGSSSPRLSPVKVADEVAAVAAGRDHTLFVKADGALWARGSNQFGQLGIGSVVTSSAAVQVATNVAVAAGGSFHSMFVKNDGTLWAMGRGVNGQLGNGGSSTTVPVQVASGVATVVAASEHSVFLKQDGTVWATGSGQGGKLGDGSTGSTRWFPIQVATGGAAIAVTSTSTLLVKSDGSLWITGNLNGETGSSTFRRIGHGVMDVRGNGSGRHALILAGRAASFVGGSKVTPLLEWTPPTLVYGEALSGVHLSAQVAAEQKFLHVPQQGVVPGSGLAVSFTLPGNFAYSIPSGTLLNAGEHVVSLTFTPQDPDLYETVTIERAITVHKAPQSISFPSIPATAFSTDLVALDVTASSGLPVALSVVSGGAVLEEDGLRMTASGPVTIRASQGGNENFHPAEAVEMTFHVLPNRLSWLHEQFTVEERSDESVSGWLADPDHDGWSNLVEYAFALQPLASDAFEPLAVIAVGAEWLIQFARPADRNDVTFRIEVSSDLVTWVPLDVTEITAADPSEVQFEGRVSRTTFPSIFARLRVQFAD